jgi:type I site-specific restriction endonuclease
LAEVTRGYGAARRPEDFLDNFTSFVRNNVNKIAALSVVVQRPRELTRSQLRELRLELLRTVPATRSPRASNCYEIGKETFRIFDL